LNYKNYFLYNLSNLNLLIFEKFYFESFFISVILLPQVYFFSFIIVLFLCFYFSYFNSYVKEENLIDFDYLVANLLVESEKEIGSLDDMIIGLIFLIFIFG